MNKSFLMTVFFFAGMVSAAESEGCESGIASPVRDHFDDKKLSEAISLEVSVESLVTNASRKHATTFSEKGERFNAFEDLCARCPNLVNRKYDGTTALHEAARAGNLHTLRVLLGWSANPNVIDGQNQTPLHVAMLAGHTEIVGELKRHGASASFSQKFLPLPLQGISSLKHSEK